LAAAARSADSAAKAPLAEAIANAITLVRILDWFTAFILCSFLCLRFREMEVHDKRKTARPRYPSRSTYDLVKNRIHHAQLAAPMVEAVHAVLSFLEAVEAFEPDTQTLAQLPDEVGAAVMTEVIELAQGVVSSRSELCWETVQIYVSVRDGGAELVAPLVRKASHCAPIVKGLELAVALERGVAG